MQKHKSNQTDFYSAPMSALKWTSIPYFLWLKKIQLFLGGTDFIILCKHKHSIKTWFNDLVEIKLFRPNLKKQKKTASASSWRVAAF